MDNCDSWEDMEASVPAPAPALAVASKLNANAPAFSSSPSFNPFHPAAAGFTSHKPQQVPGLPVSAAPHTPLQEDVSVRVAAGIVNAHAGIDSACFDFVPEDLQNIQASSDDSFGGAQSDEKEVGFQDFLENVSENDSDAIDVKEEASTCSEPVNRPATDNEDTAELNLATLNIKDKHMQAN